MDHLFSTPPSLVSFKQIYLQNISPKLQAIDLFLKTTEGSYPVDQIALVLGMKVEEVSDIMAKTEIMEITLVDFFTIVSYSSSYICRLIQRQWKYSSAPFYTPYMISYIYELNIDKVQNAFESFGKEYIAESELMDVFSSIHSPIFHITI